MYAAMHATLPTLLLGYVLVENSSSLLYL